MKRFIPQPIKKILITIYIYTRILLRGPVANGPRVNLLGVLPKPGQIVHGGKVKLLAIRERFNDVWRGFNIAYLVSSGLPSFPSIWVKIYKKFGVKVVWNQNGVAYPAWIGDKYKEVNTNMNSMLQADYIIYQTEFTKKCADKFIGQFNGPSTILINPVDTKKFVPRNTLLDQEHIKIIMSGHHFESAKRLEVSLESIRLLRANGANAKLIVIGNRQDLPQEDWIEIRGQFLQEDAPKLYQEAHILLHLKSLDPCPTVVLEALSCGLPIVGLANGGMPELVSKEAGVLVEATEDFNEFKYPAPAEVVKAIELVINNLGQYSRNARESALKFDKEVWLNKHEEIFKSLLK